jgi:hypothetical protein
MPGRILIKTKDRHPGIQDKGKQSDPDAIGSDDIFLVDRPVAGYPGGCDLVIDRGK